MKTEVLYKKIKEEIKDNIRKGILKPGERIPSIIQLSHQFKVSTITIKQAVQELVKEGYLRTQGSKGTFINSLRHNTRLIGVVLYSSPGENIFLGEIFSGIEKEASINDYHILLFNTDCNTEKEIRYLREIYERNVEGLIYAPFTSETPSVPILNEFRKHHIPVVLLDINVNNFDGDHVGINNVSGGFDATEYLIKKGHTKIGIFLGRQDISNMRDRYNGYLKALKNYGIEHNRLYVKMHTYQKFYEEMGYTCGLEILNLKDPPTAIFCTSDAMAVGLYKICSEMNIRIPEDISIVGFDNLIISDYLMPPLTTINPGKKKMGEEAVKLLMDRIKGHSSNTQNKILPHVLIERGSVSHLDTNIEIKK
ncbi:MAG: GntR family transcriptional regulator [bacterium]|nr:GntR family transcriptional regulator [bacterium]